MNGLAGSSYPLGATPSDSGANFSHFSKTRALLIMANETPERVEKRLGSL